MKRVQKVPLKYRKKVESLLRLIPKLLLAERRKRDLTQEQMAEGLEISVETLKGWESGRRTPSVAMLFYLYAFFGLEVPSRPTVE